MSYISDCFEKQFSVAHIPKWENAWITWFEEINNAAGRVYFPSTRQGCPVFSFCPVKFFPSLFPRLTTKREPCTSRATGGEERMASRWWLTSCCLMPDWFWESAGLPCWESLHWQWNGWVFLSLLVPHEWVSLLGILPVNTDSPWNWKGKTSLAVEFLCSVCPLIDCQFTQQLFYCLLQVWYIERLQNIIQKLLSVKNTYGFIVGLQKNVLQLLDDHGMNIYASRL